ncbi:MAG TPA: malto-oligosyltrehalose synthase [Methylovorus sp.]|nr:malto-oligosyltrehalose synthase [Methylovorus sp.]
MSPRYPLSTLRLQFHKGFTFADALEHIGYFSALGVSHLYASPIFTARPNSSHGYDIVDPTQINPELGGRKGLARLVQALRHVNMGLIVDIVPNHMGVGGADNPWWQHVFEWGRHSPYAMWFDIDWHSPDPYLHNKILAPFLGEPYGDVLDKGDIHLEYDRHAQRIQARYFDNAFPIALADYADILQGAAHPALASLVHQFRAFHADLPFFDIQSQVNQAVAELARLSLQPEVETAIEQALASYSAQPIDKLHPLLEKQHYRLTWWRNASDQINWRRFFEVSELAGVRVELDEVFEATHSLLFELYAQGLIDGVRLDHIDGLAQPQHYCRKLRERLEALTPNRPPSLRTRPYMIAEKILAPGESLRTGWGLDGTTGYEFMDQVSAVLHDPQGEQPLTALWYQLSQSEKSFHQHVEQARRQLLSENLVSEFEAAVHALHAIARADLHTRDYSLASIRRVFTEILVHFPVYRSYVTADGIEAPDQELFESTAIKARRTLGHVDKPLVDIIFSWLRGDLINLEQPTVVSDLTQRAITRFQQLMPPLCAKSMEDTAFYRFGRLISRNEVGSDPDMFVLEMSAFHDVCQRRQQMYPANLLATATHDHKRGEDVRARIAVISQVPTQWERQVQRWIEMNQRLHTRVFPEELKYVAYDAPRITHEYMLYQMLVGAWPFELQVSDAAGLKAYGERMQAWFIKSIREAKWMSSWVQANEPYEEACTQFLQQILDPEQSSEFLHSLVQFTEQIAPAGAINSLAQTLLRLTTPGIPDLYQGTEFWDFSLVDPDNRRPVDYPLRAQTLHPTTSATLLANWRSGAIKQSIIQRLLEYRQQHPALFEAGDYQPVYAQGMHSDKIVAFRRQHEEESLLVVVPRFCQALLAEPGSLHLQHWQDTRLENALPAHGRYRDVLSGTEHVVTEGSLSIATLFTTLPLAVLAPVQE